MKKEDYTPKDTTLVTFQSAGGTLIASALVHIEKTGTEVGFDTFDFRHGEQAADAVDLFPNDFGSYLLSRSGRTRLLVTPFLELMVGDAYSYLSHIEEVFMKKYPDEKTIHVKPSGVKS